MILLLLSASLASCMGKNAPEKEEQEVALEKPAYRLDEPQKSWPLAADLLEVSGITWVNNRQLLAIEDATRNIYVLDLGKQGAISHKAPLPAGDGSKLDLEDVALLGKTAYALRSNGNLLEVNGWETQPAVRELATELPGRFNVEGLCYDPATGKLLLAMKEPLGKKKKKAGDSRDVYVYDPKAGRLMPEPLLVIGPDVVAKMGNGKGGFNPSAIAVHPVSKEIYVLGSAGIKGLACFGRDGELKWFSPIADALMPQPEGLCFAPDGTLYISTEGNGKKPAQLFEFAKS
ncbi:MAG: hypothetical protein EOO16_17270 [Chitinophagaceae bacterium]|nr:MAG: hypothetical protein EOO16_17270 [Chitinophagaceae bacterium]